MLVPVRTLGQGINFEKGTFNDALSLAKSDNKLLFVDGYAVWCGPCKKMDKTVFLEKEVGNYFDKHLIAIKVNVERGEGPRIKQKYGIEGLPGYVFIDGDGHVVYRFSSAMPTGQFMKEVELAVSYSKDKNSIGRLAERYKVEMNDEAFVRVYLDKMKLSKSINYADVLDHFLSIQLSIKEASKEMVVLLADHSNEIIFGSKADEIIKRNFGSDVWKLYVRKDIREKYQGLKRKMVSTTTNYAISKKDTAVLELAINRASEAGFKSDLAQRKKAYSYYYLQTGNGVKYKAMVKAENNAFIESIDVAQVRAYYLNWEKRKAAKEKKALRSRPRSIRLGQQIYTMVENYGRFVTSDQEKKEIVKWMKVAFDINPGEVKTMSNYANILYTFGNDKKAALKIKESAYKLAVKENEKMKDLIKLDLEAMRDGKGIILK